jgi:hypothetical protein
MTKNLFQNCFFSKDFPTCRWSADFFPKSTVFSTLPLGDAKFLSPETHFIFQVSPSQKILGSIS